MNLAFKDIDKRTLDAAKKLDIEGFVRINKFEHGDDWMKIADEVIDEIVLLNEYKIEIEWFDISCVIKKSK